MCGDEVSCSVGFCAATKCIGSESAGECVIAATSQQFIVAATSADHIVAALGIDSIVGICAHHHVSTARAIEAAIIDLSVIRTADDAILSVNVDRGCLAVASGGTRYAGRRLRLRRRR